MAGKAGFTLALAATAVVEFMAKWSNLCPPTVRLLRNVLIKQDHQSKSIKQVTKDLNFDHDLLVAVMICKSLWAKLSGIRCLFNSALVEIVPIPETIWSRL